MIWFFAGLVVGFFVGVGALLLLLSRVPTWK